MDALRTAKAALDDGLISQADYEQVKQAFLSSMKAGVGGGGGEPTTEVEGLRSTLSGAGLADNDGGALPHPAATIAKRTGSFGALFGGGRKAAAGKRK